MSGRAILEIKLAPSRISVHQRGPVPIGQLMPVLLERYGVEEPRPAENRRKAEWSAVWLGQQSLANLAETS
jgi:hypothetical protein